MNAIPQSMPESAPAPDYRWQPIELGEGIRLGADLSATGGARYVLAIAADAGLTLLPLRPGPGEATPAALRSAALAALAQDDPDVGRRGFWAALARSPRPIAIEAFYGQMSDLNIVFGDSFKAVREIWRGDCEAIGAVRLDGQLRAQADGYLLHPAFLDACLQLFGATLFGEDSRKTFLPVGMESFYFDPGPVSAAWSHVKLRRPVRVEDVEAFADFVFYDRRMRKVGEVVGFSLRLSDHGKLMSREKTAPQPQTYRIGWERQESRLDAAAAPVAWSVHGRGADVAPLRALADGGATAGAAVLIVDGAAAQPQPDGYHARLRALLADLRAVVIDAADAGPLRLYVVTRCTQQVTGHDPIRPDQAFVWGLVRSLELEYPGLQAICIDLDDGTDIAAVAAEIASGSNETQIAFRSGTRYVARLSPMREGLALPGASAPEARRSDASGPAQPESGDRDYRLRTRAYGSFDQLYLEPLEPAAPRPGEVRIRVRATGLNFKDVLHAMGMLQEGGSQSGVESAGQMLFGGDCAGEVVAVGSGVNALAPGDRVLAAMAFGCFGSFVNIGQGLVSKLPDAMSFAEGAAIPTAYLTAYHALVNCARIAAGDRVLIHAGAGGVGLAAVQIARRLGATVCATASPSKHAFLRAMGVEAVANSRSAAFAEELAIASPGAYDVVLNSLNGEFIERSFAVLRHGGRFVEIGKIGAWTPQRAKQARPDAEYTWFDLMDLAGDDPAFVASELHKVVEFMGRHLLRPPRVRTFPIGQAAEAFRCMAEARHIGKIVVEHAAASRPPIAPDRVHVVTGGLGALGRWLVRWLAERGARHLLVAGRSATREGVEQAFADLIANGVEVAWRAADLADCRQAHELLRELDEGGRGIGDIYHLAGRLDDGLFANRTAEDFERVVDAKAAGAANLHLASLQHAHGRFVVFSSIAGVFGGAGQSNYAAANALADAIVRHRRELGLHGLSINWGPWASGMAAGLSQADRARLLDSGVSPLNDAAAASLLDALLLADPGQAVAAQLDWQRIAAAYPGGRAPALVAHLGAAQGDAAEDVRDLREELAALDGPARLEAMERAVARSVCTVLRLSDQQIAPEQTLLDLGMDSLMGMELRHRLSRQIGADVPVSVLLKGLSLSELARDLLRIAALVDIAPEVGAATAATPARWLSRVADGREGAPRLLCFHHLGGSADFFRAWASPLRDEFEVIAVQLPGRGDRADEAPIERVGDLLDALLPQVQASPARPLFLYGHSMGSHLAFEFARRWTAAGGRVERLFASGLWPPSREDAPMYASRFAERGRGALEIPQALRGDADYLRELERLIGADAALLNSCVGIGADEPCDLPLTVFSGSEDPIAPPVDVEKWRGCTRADFVHRVCPGKHMFVVEAAATIHSEFRRAGAALQAASASSLSHQE